MGVPFQSIRRLRAGLALLFTVALLGACGSDSSGGPATATQEIAPSIPQLDSWSFGVMGDTQWKAGNDGKNPNGVGTDIISQVDARFIEHGVDLVIPVGDLTEDGNPVDLDTRALFAQPLYNAGVGFYPLRGNHDKFADSATEFVRVFPQTRDGVQNMSPADVLDLPGNDWSVRLAVTLLGANVDKSGEAFTVGRNFSAPMSSLEGLSYAFEHNNATFVLLDRYTLADGNKATIESQLPWIEDRLAGRPSDAHAFVLTHQPLIGEKHAGGLMGESGLDVEDAFINSLWRNNVLYLITGHDHMHDVTRVTTTDGVSAHVVQQISASCSSKYYTPVVPSNDETYNDPRRQAPIQQELYSAGYYIYSVQGDNVTVDFYADFITEDGEDLRTTPRLNFTHRTRWGYGLRGEAFFIAPGESYAAVEDHYQEGGLTTRARLLGGTNTGVGTDYAGRAFSRMVNTGWVTRVDGLASHILRLWGLPETVAEGGSAGVPLSLSYDPAKVTPEALSSGRFALAYLDEANRRWINAASTATSGPTSFVDGPWEPTYPPGTHGVDRSARTVWAVVRGNGHFAALTLPAS